MGVTLGIDTRPVVVAATLHVAIMKWCKIVAKIAHDFHFMSLVKRQWYASISIVIHLRKKGPFGCKGSFYPSCLTILEIRKISYLTDCDVCRKEMIVGDRWLSTTGWQLRQSTRNLNLDIMGDSKIRKWRFGNAFLMRLMFLHAEMHSLLGKATLPAYFHLLDVSAQFLARKSRREKSNRGCSIVYTNPPYLLRGCP